MGQMNHLGVRVTPLQRMANASGDVLHAMKATDVGYAGFGEAYFSWISPNAVKAWKRHTRMTMNLVVPLGSVQFVFAQNNHQFFTEEIGESDYARLTVPPGIWFGFKGKHIEKSLILNVASITHDTNEIERFPKDHFDYLWD